MTLSGGHHTILKAKVHLKKVMKNTMKVICVLLLIIAYNGDKILGVRSNQIDEKNWMAHPSIVEIQNIFKNINNSINNGEAIIKKKEFSYCKQYEDTERLLYLDKKSKQPMRYTFTGGSEDSSRTVDAYYSESKIVFMYVHGENVHDAKFEYRIYFNKETEIIWRVYQYRDPFGEEEYFNDKDELYESEIPYDPMKEYTSSNVCDHR